ncbi:hypothetical protein ES705_14579 [subsurface metagenome]
MPDSWQKFHKEIERFSKRETAGFSGDIAALEDHIKRLRSVAPKDKAGYPFGNAQDYLQRLNMSLAQAKKYATGVTG